METLYVVARYNEDISWIDEIKDGSFLIYNKGEDFDTKYSYVNVPNVGREAETFLKAIVSNYHNLSMYDNVVFLQGSPKEHFFGLIDFLNNPNEILKNTWYGLSHNCPHLNFHRNQMLFYFPSIYSKILDCPEIEPEKYVSDDPVEEKYFRDLVDLLFLCGINHSLLDYKWSTGAQYSVPTSMLLNKPHQWWCKVYFLFELYEKYKKDENRFPWIIERGWPALWSYVPCVSS
jgi:hypothetical protein